MTSFGSNFTKAISVDKHGQPVAFDLQFKSGAPVNHTISFVKANEPLHLYIDVDANDLPVALSFIHAPTPQQVAKYKQLSDEEIRAKVDELYGFAAKMILIKGVADKIAPLIREKIEAAMTERFKELEAATPLAA